MGSAADAVSRILAGIEAGEMRAHKAAALLSRMTSEEAVGMLGELLRKADTRANPHSAALEGLLRAVRSLVAAGELDALFRAAEAANDLEVQALLARTAPAKSFDQDRADWVDREMHARTLGERRALAKKHDRDLLARLASDQDPVVVRNVLANARCTEREVLLAASRRPQRSDVLEEIFRSRRWSTYRRVRRALALNPYSPPALAAAALALLTGPDLREVAEDLSIAPEVRVQARRLLAHRSGKPE
jgi:hypothetical protein